MADTDAPAGDNADNVLDAQGLEDSPEVEAHHCISVLSVGAREN